MTPKEKAKELVDKYELSFAGMISNEEDWETLAKECALIAVNEILNLNDIDGEYSFYLKVKQEIENL